MGRVNIRIFAATLGLLLGTSNAAHAAHAFADWTGTTAFTLNSIFGTVSTSNPVNVGGTTFFSPHVNDGRTNYPGTWFTPAPPEGTLWSETNINNATDGSVASIDITVTFSEPVSNPRFHFVNLDNGTVDFGSYSFSHLSGNPEFEVSGAVLNANPSAAANVGCEDASGGNPNGACGTIELMGSVSSVTFTVTDTNTLTGAGDGFQWTISADEVSAVPTLSEWALGIVILLTALLGLRGEYLRPGRG